MNTLEIKYLTSKEERKRKGIFDVLIDGISLYESLELNKSQNICVFGFFSNIDLNISFANQFLKLEESKLITNRYELFVCKECGDIGCGSVTLSVEKTNSSYLWQNFAFENDSFDLEDEDFFELSSFEFSIDEYERVFNEFKRDLLKLYEVVNQKNTWKSFWKL